VKIAYDKRKADQINKDAKPFWVTLCGKEKLCQPRALVCEADDYDGVTQATRIRALSEVSISFEKPTCVCGCPEADDQAAAAQLQAAVASASAGQAVSGSGDPCHAEHETRVDCAEDCGCGTACDCGCCVLLAQVSLVDGVWTPKHQGVRRLVRAALVADREPGAPPPAPPADKKEAPPAEKPAEPAPAEPVQPEAKAAEPVAEPVTAPAAAVAALP
jgi:hypothetical protein